MRRFLAEYVAIFVALTSVIAAVALAWFVCDAWHIGEEPSSSSRSKVFLECLSLSLVGACKVIIRTSRALREPGLAREAQSAGRTVTVLLGTVGASFAGIAGWDQWKNGHVALAGISAAAMVVLAADVAWNLAARPRGGTRPPGRA